jgi:hypothetical protein
MSEMAKQSKKNSTKVSKKSATKRVPAPAPKARKAVAKSSARKPKKAGAPFLDGVIHYLNTDLDLTSPDDLTPLAAHFEARGVFPLHVMRCDDGRWDATFESVGPHTEPEPNIAAMLAVVESLRKPLRTVWARCSLREFNIGYDCGLEPWAFNQGLSAELLGRMSAAGASLRITLYPDREPKDAR